MAGEQNIVKYKKVHSVNMGLIIFFVILVYIAFNVFQYFTSETIAPYEVTQGSIAANNTYRGLILRQETVVNAEHSGYVNYYIKNGSRVSVNDVIYSIDTKGDISDRIYSESTGNNILSADAMREISASLDTFSASYRSSDFSYAVHYKEDLASTLLQMVNSAALARLGDEVASAADNHTFFMLKPERTGIVAYYTDGYEDMDIGNFSPSWIDAASYGKKNLNAHEKVLTNDAVYKLVTSEEWDILIEIPEQEAEALSEKSSIRIRFCEDDFTTNARCKVMEVEKRFFLDLTLQTAMVRYLNERFVDIELVVSEKTGLKIPKSAITTKEFFTVPKEAFTLGGDSKNHGLMIVMQTEEGETVNFVTPTIYYETEQYYYIDNEDVSAGDVVLYNNSAKRYLIGTDVSSLIGVYNINKGYAVFKQISIMYENEDYAIVEQRTAYGIALYDHIALDGSKLTENQLTAK